MSAPQPDPAELFDPYRADVQLDPYPVYRALRDDHPAYRNESRGFWALSRYADVVDALRDHTTFSSEGSLAVGGVDVTALLPMMIMMDPPRHDRLRALVSHAFTPRRIESIAPAIARAADRFASRIVEGGDVVTDFAGPFPIQVMTDMLGVAAGDARDFRRWTEQFVQGDPASHELSRAALDGAGALYQLLGDMLAHRRRAPGDDLLSALLDATADGERLAHDELVGFCFLLLVAGTETTTSVIANGLVALSAHPGAKHALCADPAAIPAAVEEILRYDGPVQGLARVARRDIEFHGTTIPAGAQVLLLFAAANRDDREFERPDDFDIGRRPHRHLAFGHGIHRCLGAALARLEARVAFERLFARLPAFDVDPSRGQRLSSSFLRGFRHLPVSETGHR